MKKRFTLLYLSVLSIILFSLPHAFTENTIKSDSYINQLQKSSIIKRDSTASSLMNSRISFTAVVKSVDENRRYNRRFRVVAEDISAAKYNMRISYFIFMGNRDIWLQINEGEKYHFTGLVTAYTPLNTQRDYYIFDVLFESIEIIVK